MTGGRGPRRSLGGGGEWGCSSDVGGTATSSSVNRWGVWGIGMDDEVGVGHTGDDARREGQGLGHHSAVLGMAGAAAGEFWRGRPGAMGRTEAKRGGVPPGPPPTVYQRQGSLRGPPARRPHCGGSKKDRLCTVGDRPWQLQYCSMAGGTFTTMARPSIPTAKGGNAKADGTPSAVATRLAHAPRARRVRSATTINTTACRRLDRGRHCHGPV